MERQVTIAIVEDHPVVVEGVTSWVNGDPARRIRIVQVTSDLADLGPGADVIVLDLELGGQMITEVPGLVAGGHRIVVFSAHVDPSIILAVLRLVPMRTSPRMRAATTWSRR